MLGRKQELNLQFQQISDGLLMSFAFWLAHTLRFIGGEQFGFDRIAPFSQYQWLLFVLMPFGPIILELQGFYTHPLQKTVGRSFQQMLHAGVWLGVLVAACAFFLQLAWPPRAVVPMFAVFACTAV